MAQAQGSRDLSLTNSLWVPGIKPTAGASLSLPATRPPASFTDGESRPRWAEPPPDRPSCPADVPIESLRLRFALLQSLNTTLETFFLPLVELRQTPMYTHSIAALLKEAKGQCLSLLGRPRWVGSPASPGLLQLPRPPPPHPQPVLGHENLFWSSGSTQEQLL